MNRRASIELMESMATDVRSFPDGFSCRTEDGKVLSFTAAQMDDAKMAAQELLEYFVARDEDEARAIDAG